MQRRCFITLLLFALPGVLVASRANAQVKERPNLPSGLFKRYENGAGANRIIEDVLTLTIAFEPENRSIVAVRVCSKQSLPLGLVTTSIDVFHVAELLTSGYAYTPDRVVFLRSADCLAKEAAQNATEVWALSQASPLPAHAEKLLYSEAQRVALGKKEELRGGDRDYRSALDELIRALKLDSSARGVVLGFYRQKPGAAMKRRLKEVERILRLSGLPRDQYLVTLRPWNDESWEGDTEPRYPAVYIIKKGD